MEEVDVDRGVVELLEPPNNDPKLDMKASNWLVGLGFELSDRVKNWWCLGVKSSF